MIANLLTEKARFEESVQHVVRFVVLYFIVHCHNITSLTLKASEKKLSIRLGSTNMHSSIAVCLCLLAYCVCVLSCECTCGDFLLLPEMKRYFKQPRLLDRSSKTVPNIGSIWTGNKRLPVKLR